MYISAYVTKHLFLGQYLPQGSILQHPKVKLFVTHCGANSVLDSIHAVKPMITFPGFADQPLTSNILINLRVAKLLKKFDYQQMELRIEEMLAEPNYSEMLGRLQKVQEDQVKLGGYKAGVEIVEKVIEGQIKVNKSIAAEDVIGSLYTQFAISVLVFTFAIFMLILVLVCCCRVLCCRNGCCKCCSRSEKKQKTHLTKKQKSNKVD